MQIRASKTMSKTPKKYSRPSSRGNREYRVQMTFLASVSIKLKTQTCLRSRLKEKRKRKSSSKPKRNINNLRTL